MLKYDTNLNGYVVNLDKRILEGAPSYSTRERVDLADEAYGRRVHYKMPAVRAVDEHPLLGADNPRQARSAAHSAASENPSSR
jgi:hypothetical protein